MFSLFLYRDEEKEQDPKGKAEEDFWTAISQDKKEIEARERRRQEALNPKQQPTPIPEETTETTPIKVCITFYAHCNCIVDTFTFPLVQDS